MTILSPIQQLSNQQAETEAPVPGWHRYKDRGRVGSLGRLPSQSEQRNSQVSRRRVTLKKSRMADPPSLAEVLSTPHRNFALDKVWVDSQLLTTGELVQKEINQFSALQDFVAVASVWAGWLIATGRVGVSGSSSLDSVMGLSRLRSLHKLVSTFIDNPCPGACKRLEGLLRLVVPLQSIDEKSMYRVCTILMYGYHCALRLLKGTLGYRDSRRLWGSLLGYLAGAWDSGPYFCCSTSDSSVRDRVVELIERQDIVQWAKEQEKLAGGKVKRGILINRLFSLAKTNRLERKQAAKSRKPPGSKGISNQARMNIYSACDLMQHIHGKDCLSFWTITLPPAIWDNGNFNWEYFVKIVMNELNRTLKRVGCPVVNFVRVVEKHKDGRPHLHIVFWGRLNKRSPWWLSTRILDEIIFQAVRLQKPVSLNDLRASSQVKQVEKDAAEYLSKYMSKGSDLSGWHPKCWYSISHSLSKILKASEVAIDVFYDGRDINLFKAELVSQGLISESYHLRLASGKYLCGWGRAGPMVVEESYRRARNCFEEMLSGAG